MRSFWMWLGWLAAIWIVFLVQIEPSSRYAGFIACAIFFALIYVLPLLRQRPMLLFCAISMSTLTIGWMIISLRDEMSSLTALSVLFLLFSYLAGEAVYRLPAKFAFTYGILGFALFLGAVYRLTTDMRELVIFAVLYGVAAAFCFVYFSRIQGEYRDSRSRYEALLNEFRQLKRNMKSTEEAARLEERTNIARRIHDSVGHKLTSLLLQLEMFRMNEGPEVQRKAEQMKQLAQDSLDETRKAVKALKDEEPGGIPAILRLIRNLEAESYLQVEFAFRHGALSAVLSSEQSVAVYRAIQEALTNAMRHGASRNVSVMLESPGGTMFRFEVINDVKDKAHDRTDTGEIDHLHNRSIEEIAQSQNRSNGESAHLQNRSNGDTNERSRSKSLPAFREGFGLTAMRERIEKAGGQLDIQVAGGKFTVRGTFMLNK